MSHIRWWVGKTSKSHLVPTNDELGINKRIYVTNESKAVELTPVHLKQVSDPYIKYNLQLQANFGLRREESIKFNTHYADKVDRIILKAGWCKGGISREIPIVTTEQRSLIDQIKSKYGNSALIPPHLQYKHQKDLYKNTIPKIGLGKGTAYDTTTPKPDTKSYQATNTQQRVEEGKGR